MDLLQQYESQYLSLVHRIEKSVQSPQPDAGRSRRVEYDIQEAEDLVCHVRCAARRTSRIHDVKDCSSAGDPVMSMQVAKMTLEARSMTGPKASTLAQKVHNPAAPH